MYHLQVGELLLVINIMVCPANSTVQGREQYFPTREVLVSISAGRMHLAASRIRQHIRATDMKEETMYLNARIMAHQVI